MVHSRLDTPRVPCPSFGTIFSLESEPLGDKSSLQEQICKATNIPTSALQAKSLSQFQINERMRWIDHRETCKEEDKAYSLRGIFGISMIPNYGEGVAKAFDRLWNKIREIQKCMQDLRPTDPRLDKERIKDTTGGVLKEAYRSTIPLNRVTPSPFRVTALRPGYNEPIQIIPCPQNLATLIEP